MSVVFFTDRDLGLKFPEILAAGGLAVERHADNFAPDCPDGEWLAAVSARGWVAVTHDGRIRYKPNELAALVEHKAALLVVIGAAPYPDLAQAFVATAPRIVEFINDHERPFIAKVYRASPADAAKASHAAGRVVLWYPRG